MISSANSGDAGTELKQRPLMLLGSELGGRLMLLRGLAGLHLQGLLDDAIGEGVKVGRQGALQLQEFRPEGVVDIGGSPPATCFEHLGSEAEVTPDTSSLPLANIDSGFRCS